MNNDHTRPPNLDLREMEKHRVRLTLASQTYGDAIRWSFLQCVMATAQLAHDSCRVREMMAMTGSDDAVANVLLEQLEQQIADHFERHLGISIFEVVEAAVRQGIPLPSPETLGNER